MRIFLITILSCIVFACQNDSEQKKSVDFSSIADSTDKKLNHCFEMNGELPDLTVLNEKFYGKVFIAIVFNFNKNEFEKYEVMRSTLKLKADDSIYSTYDADSKILIPEIYKEIIFEVKSRIDKSGLKMIRKTDGECVNNNWITLPVTIN